MSQPRQGAPLGTRTEDHTEPASTRGTAVDVVPQHDLNGLVVQIDAVSDDLDTVNDRTPAGVEAARSDRPTEVITPPSNTTSGAPSRKASATVTAGSVPRLASAA